MPDTIEGSVEIKTAGGESIGVAGKRWTVAAVPMVVETLHGVTGMAIVTPEQQPTGRTPEAQWSAVDANNQTITVMLWEDVAYEDTAIAQAIAQAIADGGDTNGY